MNPLFEATTAQQVHDAVAQGFDVNECRLTLTPLIKACIRGNFDVTKALLQHGARSTYDRFPHRNPVTSAILHGRVEIVDLLIHYGVDINQAYPAIVKAGMTSFCPIIHLLIRRGANINSQDFEGATALMKACQFGSKKMVRTILFYSPDLSIKDIYGQTAVSYASENLRYKILDLLLDYDPTLLSP